MHLLTLDYCGVKLPRPTVVQPKNGVPQQSVVELEWREALVC